MNYAKQQRNNREVYMSPIARYLIKLFHNEEGENESQILAKLIWESFDADERDSFRALMRRGPVWDGDIPSKTGRDELLTLGLAVRCCVTSEQGYTALSYLGGRFCRFLGLDDNVCAEKKLTNSEIGSWTRSR